MRVLLGLAIFAQIALTVRALAAPAGSQGNQDGARLFFEVASVKASHAVDPRPRLRFSPSGQLELTDFTLRSLIRMAYGSETIRTSVQILGGPKWMDSERFVVLAKAEGNPGVDIDGRPSRIMAMLRSLLEDRFLVMAHVEKKEAPAFSLVLDRPDRRFGPALTKSNVTECYSAANPPPRNAPPDPGGFCRITGGNGRVIYAGLTMPQIAASLADYPLVNRPVIDATGLSGKYDMHLEFVPAVIGGPGSSPSAVADPAADSGPNLFTALAEQAGLRLQNERAQVDFLVVDQAVRPGED
jgi:uncharacterized protein (TIGR03435 family)